MNNNSENNLDLQEQHNSRVAYYDSLVKAWIQNRMELDKQLLTLSALASGLLVTVFGQPENINQFVLWLIGSIAFLCCGAFILIIFHKNSRYLETVINLHQREEEENNATKKQEETETKELNSLTKIASSIFLLGVASTIILAIIHSNFITTIGD